MAYQKATVNGMVCVVDSATPTVPVRDVGGDLGDVICESAFQLSRKRVAVACLDLMSANTGTAMFPTASGTRGILNGTGDQPFVSVTNTVGFQANGSFYGGLSSTVAGHGCSVNGQTEYYGKMMSYGIGSSAHGYASNYGIFQVYGHGSCARGFANNYGQLGVDNGSIAHGTADGGVITATGIGSHAHGRSLAANYSINAAGHGSHAMGYIPTGCYSIEATGAGSLAMGQPSTGQSIVASGVGSVQIGDGTNAIPNSIALKGSIRMKPDNTGTLRNGDFWYNTSTHKFQGRANGATVDFH